MGTLTSKPYTKHSHFHIVIRKRRIYRDRQRQRRLHWTQRKREGERETERPKQQQNKWNGQINDSISNYTLFSSFMPTDSVSQYPCLCSCSGIALTPNLFIIMSRLDVHSYLFNFFSLAVFVAAQRSAVDSSPCWMIRAIVLFIVVPVPGRINGIRNNSEHKKHTHSALTHSHRAMGKMHLRNTIGNERQPPLRGSSFDDDEMAWLFSPFWFSCSGSVLFFFFVPFFHSPFGHNSVSFSLRCVHDTEYTQFNTIIVRVLAAHSGPCSIRSGARRV